MALEIIVNSIDLKNVDTFSALDNHLTWGALTLERGCAAVMTPFFQASQRSLAYQFTINALLMCPHFQFVEKVCISALFWLKFSFPCKTPHFSGKSTP